METSGDHFPDDELGFVTRRAGGAPGEVGELTCRGPYTLRGLLRRAGIQAAVLPLTASTVFQTLCAWILRATT